MIELAEVIQSIRREINKAREAGAAEGLRFEVGPIELELSITATESAEGGVKVYVANLNGQRASETSQRMKFVLKPIDENTGAGPQVGALYSSDRL